MIGDRKVECDAINYRKACAGAGQTGNFGVTKFPQGAGAHPDAGMSHDAMNDGSRGAGPAIGKGSHGRQAAPDHGGMGKDHFYRQGKL